MEGVSDSARPGFVGDGETADELESRELTPNRAMFARGRAVTAADRAASLCEVFVNSKNERLRRQGVLGFLDVLVEFAKGCVIDAALMLGPGGSREGHDRDVQVRVEAFTKS